MLQNAPRCISGNNGAPQWTEERHKIADMATKPYPHMTTHVLGIIGKHIYITNITRINIFQIIFFLGQSSKKVSKVV